jgi:hypothetical protein
VVVGIRVAAVDTRAAAGTLAAAIAKQQDDFERVVRVEVQWL